MEFRLSALDLPPDVDRPAFDEQLRRAGMFMRGNRLYRRLPDWL